MPKPPDLIPSFSRRAFLKGFGTAAVTTATSGAQAVAEELQRVDPERAVGPEAVAMTLTINGQQIPVEVEPRTTLLDVLRHQLDYTGAKEGCGRGSCGACSVLLDGKPAYACMKLAIDAQDQAITTVEGLADGDDLSALQQAFIDEDGLQCGYCTSGFLVTLTALLEANPAPTEAEVRAACAGNLCRCGSYPRIVQSALRATGQSTQSSIDVIRLTHGERLA